MGNSKRDKTYSPHRRLSAAVIVSALKDYAKLSRQKKNTSFYSLQYSKIVNQELAEISGDRTVRR